MFLAAEEEARLKKAKLEKELVYFWKDVLQVLRQPPDDSKLHDIARLEYVVKEAIIPENLEDPEQKVIV